jgi:hypothetical protein
MIAFVAGEISRIAAASGCAALGASPPPQRGYISTI